MWAFRACLSQACLLNWMCVCLCVCFLCTWASLFGNVHVRIAVIICVNRSSVGNILHSTNHWHVYSVSFLSSGFPPLILPISMLSASQLQWLRWLGFRGGGSLHRLDTHTHTLFNLPFTQSLLGRSATMCCSFQSMDAKGSKSWIKVQHGTPFCMLPALHLIKVQTEKPKHLHVYDGPRKL